MKKKVLTIALTAALFVSAASLGLSAVFRVDSVAVEASTVSESGRAQVAQLQAELSSLYDRDSMFFVGQEKSNDLLKKYPYLRVTGFSKTYPNKIVLSLVEDVETYAVEAGDGAYYILNDEGVVVERRASHLNRFDGVENVVVRGLRVSGEKGALLRGEKVSTVSAFCRAMDNALGGIRKNVLSVELDNSAEEVIWVTMREGVKLRIVKPTEFTEQKSVKAVEGYFALTDKQRMTGYLLVVNDGDDVVMKYFDKIN